MGEEGGRPPPVGRGADRHEEAARQLAGLLAPLRFAARDGFAALPRVAGLEEALRGAVARAKAAGAPESRALTGLERLATGFDALSLGEKKRALAAIAGHLASLIPVPPELRDLAARGRLEAGGDASETPNPNPTSTGNPTSTANPTETSTETLIATRTPTAKPTSTAKPTATPTPTATSTPTSTPTPTPISTSTPVDRAGETALPTLPEPRDASERAARRKRLRSLLSDLPRAHPAPRALLEERGHATVEAALSFWPKAYQDRTAVRRVADLRTGEPGLAMGEVRTVQPARMRNGKPLLKVGLVDASGRLDLVFFNPPPWRLKNLAVGDALLASGKVTEGFGGRRQMSQPEVEKVGPADSASFGRIVPIYAGPADYQHPALRRLMKRLCDELVPYAVDELPAAVRERRQLLPAAQALREAHFPPPGTDPAHAAERATPAFRRLVFEELFFLQLAMALRRRGVRREPGIAFRAGPEEVAEAVRPLPFTLTSAQTRALGEIARDMSRAEPMNRLLQGDVGSGKTAVAFAAMMLAVRSGWQAVLMAPTEILAEQHARTLGGWLTGSGTEIALVTAGTRGKEGRGAREALASGRARIGVGTHALLEGAVGLDKLGLVVVDEQHRFGVLQRARLIAKGRRPDVLVMTATPIPRTLALAFYGDLDESKIDELPPGRTPVVTRVFGDAQRTKAYDLARRELDAGRQAYVVYPLVSESEKTDLADATSGRDSLAGIFAPHAVGLLHGQMKPGEKEEVMGRFRRGELAMLVATTVIEVGVDVANASVMIVEHAERFGLSQLHQLRGRVGRGAARSFCLLVAHFERAGDGGRDRLRAMVRTQDGFEIARADLKLRGPGELLGTRQSGQKLFDIADLYRDEAILEEAREEAFAIVEADPELALPEHRAAAEALAERWAARISLARVG